MTRNQFFKDISDILDADGLAYVQSAYWLVKEAHRRQFRRISGVRYFEHVRDVAHMAIEFGHCDPEDIVLGLGHDLVEDTFVPQQVIVNLLGSQMYGWILDLSKEIPAFNRVTGTVIGRAKRTPEEYWGNLLVSNIKPRRTKGYDRIHNLRDLKEFEIARRDKYIIETEKYVLPITDVTDIRVSAKIRSMLLDI